MGYLQSVCVSKYQKDNKQMQRQINKQYVDKSIILSNKN